MRRDLVDPIVDAVLYEGYILYPYRPSSVKNRQRWTFGAVYPQVRGAAQSGSEPATMQTQCLVLGNGNATLEVCARFLHLLAREVGQLDEPISELPCDAEPACRLVESLRIGGDVVHSWQEAVEREVAAPDLPLRTLTLQGYCLPFAFPSRKQLESLHDTTGAIAGILIRRQSPVQGSLELTAEQLEEGLFKITVRIINTTPVDENRSAPSRDAALMQGLVSAHTILGVDNGEFISLLDPPERFRQFAGGCVNAGTWPVLVGEEGDRTMLLSSPIILYDYPQVAPQSPGDLFDGTEIDEILTLRILAMTEAEKAEMRQVDDRARALLARTESLQPEQLMQLHGAMRRRRPIDGTGR